MPIVSFITISSSLFFGAESAFTLQSTNLLIGVISVAISCQIFLGQKFGYVRQSKSVTWNQIQGRLCFCLATWVTLVFWITRSERASRAEKSRASTWSIDPFFLGPIHAGQQTLLQVLNPISWDYLSNTSPALIDPPVVDDMIILL